MTELPLAKVALWKFAVAAAAVFAVAGALGLGAAVNDQVEMGAGVALGGVIALVVVVWTAVRQRGAAIRLDGDSATLVARAVLPQPLVLARSIISSIELEPQGFQAGPSNLQLPAPSTTPQLVLTLAEPVEIPLSPWGAVGGVDLGNRYIDQIAVAFADPDDASRFAAWTGAPATG